MKPSFVRRSCVLLGVLFLTVSAAGAQQNAPRVDPRTVPALRAEFDRAEKQGLPVEPLVAKARLGYLSQASEKKIREVVRGFADNMIRARKALEPVRGTAELAAGAEAIQAGVPDRMLRNLRAASRTRSIEVGLGVLTEMVSRGASLDMAVSRVEAMLSREVADATLIAFGNDVMGDVAAGVAPTVALDIRSQSVLSLLPTPVQASALAPNRTPPPR
jgi:hypothetical protein